MTLFAFIIIFFVVETYQSVCQIDLGDDEILGAEIFGLCIFEDFVLAIYEDNTISKVLKSNGTSFGVESITNNLPIAYRNWLDIECLTDSDTILVLNNAKTVQEIYLSNYSIRETFHLQSSASSFKPASISRVKHGSDYKFYFSSSEDKTIEIYNMNRATGNFTFVKSFEIETDELEIESGLTSLAYYDQKLFFHSSDDMVFGVINITENGLNGDLLLEFSTSDYGDYFTGMKVTSASNETGNLIGVDEYNYDVYFSVDDKERYIERYFLILSLGFDGCIDAPEMTLVDIIIGSVVGALVFVGVLLLTLLIAISLILNMFKSSSPVQPEDGENKKEKGETKK